MNSKHSLLLLLVPIIASAQNYCPVLTCDDGLPEGVCYRHSGDSPVTSIKV